MELDQAAYAQNPCGASSLPYWKARRMEMPEDVRILHASAWPGVCPAGYADELYFRLYHDLRALKTPRWPAAFEMCGATLEEVAAHIRTCYSGARVSAQTLLEEAPPQAGLRLCWVAAREKKSGELAATALAVVYAEMREASLEWIQVSPAFRRRGLGACVVRALLERLAEQADFATVSGRARHEARVENLYRACGFTGQDVWHILTRVQAQPSGLEVPIQRINGYEDARFSQTVLHQHGAFLVDGEPCAFEVVGLREARVDYAGPYLTQAIAEFRFYAEHITEFRNLAGDVVAAFPPVALRRCAMADIQPSQFCVDADKVRAVEEFVKAEEDVVIPVASVEGRLVSCDGHTRMYVAAQRGLTHVLTFFASEPGDYLSAFAHEARKRGVNSVDNLPCLPHAAYEVRWNQFCDDFFAARRGE